MTLDMYHESMSLLSIGTIGGDVDVWRPLVSLVVVLGLMYGVLYWLRRRGGIQGGGSRRMRVIERMPIDSRRHVLLVQVDDRELVLGVTNEKITTLHVLEKRVIDES